VDLAAHAGLLLERLQGERVLVVGAHELEVADAQGDGVHGEVGGEVAIVHARSGGGRVGDGGRSGSGGGVHGVPFEEWGRPSRGMRPSSTALLDFSTISAGSVLVLMGG